MALNGVYAESRDRIRYRDLSLITVPTSTPTTIQPGVPVVFADGPGVSITASGNATKTESTTLPPELTAYTYKNGGVGNASGAAAFAFDGTWEFAVTGATTSTANNVRVYITNAGALTLTVDTNTAFGWTDYPPGYAKSNGVAPVRIGA